MDLNFNAFDDRHFHSCLIISYLYELIEKLTNPCLFLLVKKYLSGITDRVLK